MELTVSGVPSRGAVAHTGGLDNGRFGSHAARPCARLRVRGRYSTEFHMFFHTRPVPGVGRLN